ncbi:MAG TPA: DMT family transporter [Thermohalobaculum sp.]|nr:DMT family transporter [Thermohalobaculum sp.]
MSRTSIFEGSDADRPGAAAGLMLVALIVLALQDSIIRLVGADTSLWQFQMIRSMGNLVLLMVLARVIWGTAPKWPKRLWAVALRSVLLLSSMILFFGGVPTLTMAEMGAGLYTFPIFVTLLSLIVLGERVGPWRAAAVLAGAAGALMILQPASASFHWVKLLPVGAGLCYAGMIITTRRWCRPESPVTLAFGVAIAYFAATATGLAVLSLFPAGPATEAAIPYLARGWVPLGLTIVLVALACSVLNVCANLCLTMAYQNAESSWLAPIDYSYLIFVTLWGLAIFGEFPDPLMLAGMALIAASGTLTAWREQRRNRPLPPPATR